MSTKHSLEQIVNVSKEIFKTCSLTDALIELTGTGKLIVNSFWSQADIEKNERTKFERTHLFEIDDNHLAQLIHVSRPVLLKNDVWNVKSPNNLRTAIVNNWKDSKEGKEEQFIEIWDNEKRLEILNLTKLDKHSKIYENSSCLGSFVWSYDSKKIAYVAEVKNIAKEKCFLTSKTSAGSESTSDKSKDEILTENNYEKKYSNFYVDDWGEQYVGKSQSVVSILSLDSLEVQVLDKLPENYTPGELSWYKNEGLVISAYYTKPYRLGLIYCPIRRSELFYYDLVRNTCTQITDGKNENFRDPKFSHDYEYVCWLQNPARGAHFQCSKLMMMKWSTKEVTTLVDIVNEGSSKGFPGIFSIKLAKDCWSLDNKRILLNTHWRSANRIISIDIETKQVTSLENGIEKMNSLECLRFSNDWICGNLQGYNRRPSLVIGKLPQRGSESRIQWKIVEIQDNLNEKATVELITHLPKVEDSNYRNISFESILVESTQKNNGLVVFPHGGPHGAFCCEFSAHVAIFYSLGFSVLLVNYRGSAGFGQDSIDCLPGKVGTNDVNDVQEAAEFVMKKYNFDKAYVYGGSHGGFLTTHLIGQFPDYYKAAAARNPVTNLQSMHSLSDIPDWVACEGFGVYDFDLKLFSESGASTQLYDKSPIKYVNNVKTPILLMIGNIDLRVPPSQGIQYYKHLIAKNVPANLMVFKEDCHPLDRCQTTADCIVSTILWFEKYSN